MRLGSLALGLNVIRGVGGVVPSTTSVSQGGVTFEVDGVYSTGNFADGPAYIVIPSGTASMSEPTPAETTVSGYVVNGAQINPGQTLDQGYDQRGDDFNVARTASFPVDVIAGDIIVKSVHNDAPGIVPGSAARVGVVTEYAACYIVASAPPAGSFAPAAVGWSGRGTPAHYTLDIPALVAALPSYDTTGHAIHSYESIINKIGKFVPVLGQYSNNPLAYRTTFPANMGNGLDLYGRYIAGTVGLAGKALLSNAFTSIQKETLATHLVSLGIQWFDAYDGNYLYEISPNGGHLQFNFMPMALALAWTGRTSEFSDLLGRYGGNFRQAFRVTSAQAAQFVPHTDYSKPFTWREREITAISGNDITVSTYRVGSSGDNTKTGIAGMTLTNGTATATVTVDVPGQDIPSGTGTITFTVDDATGFSVTDNVWLVPDHIPSVGDYDWTIEGVNVFNEFNPSKFATYRELNEWTGQVLFLKAAGIWHPSWNAVQGLVQTSNAADTPAIGWDFPDHHNDSWDADFWDDHAATILASSLTGATDAADGVTGGTWAVTPDAENGTLYRVTSTSATKPNAAQMKAGQDHTGAAAPSESVAITTAAEITGVSSGLTADTEYFTHFMVEDAFGVQSAVATASGFTAFAAPSLTVAPEITGTAEVGQVLTCNTGTWSGTGTISYARQWLRDGADIAGATSSTYTLVGADNGTDVSCRVTATDDNGSTVTTAPAVSVTYGTGFAVDEGASGGTFSTVDGKRIWRAANGDSLVVTTAGSVNALLVGGGGSGGFRRGGGGGAGEIVQRLLSGTALTLPVGTYAATVGSGAPGPVGTNGGDTTFAGLTALGGGGGAGISQNGLDGGSGGGAGGNGATNGGASTASDGVGNAGSASNSNNTLGGGGGGAVGAGVQGGANLPGHGGAGLASPIPGESKEYGWGGGAGNLSSGPGGQGAPDGSGNGAVNLVTLAVAGADGTGSGGGGGADTNSGANRNGAAGGSGAVVLWWDVGA